MLNKLRNFSKGKLAGVLVGIIIIPFVFWGMGSVFSGGNTNSIAKINSYNVSTKDFSEFINNSKISQDFIRENINNDILEQILSQLISVSIVDIEIKDLNISISDKILAKKIKEQKLFQDENNNFSRTKYEKFLLEGNLTSVVFEKSVRENELKKELFKYISGGIKSPFFLINKTYKDQLKKVEIDYINLDSVYINKDNISLEDLKKHVEKNKEKFSVEIMDISFVKITPESIVDGKEFTEEFFSKIDEIEDLILNNESIEEISSKYNLKINNVANYQPNNDGDDILKDIYNKKVENQVELIDKNNFFLLYEAKNFRKILPEIDDQKFLSSVRNDLFEKNKYDLHKDLLKKIQLKNFTNEDFLKISKGKTKSLNIKSINDVSKFTPESINLIYSLNKNNFSLVSDERNIVYLIKVKNIFEKNLEKNHKDAKNFIDKTNLNVRDKIYSSYDYLLNEKYKVKINQNTLDRMKNYFR